MELRTGRMVSWLGASPSVPEPLGFSPTCLLGRLEFVSGYLGKTFAPVDPPVDIFEAPVYCFPRYALIEW
jgi:hypothetical protein